MSAIVIDSDAEARGSLCALLLEADVRARDFGSTEAALRGIAEEPDIALVFLDDATVQRDPMRLALLAQLNAIAAPPIIVRMSHDGPGGPDTAVWESVADHFLPEPVDRPRLQGALDKARSEYLLRCEVRGEFPLPGESPSMRDVRSETARIARSDARVLIISEDELAATCAAYRIHACSSRCNQPLEVYRCAGSELDPSRAVAELLGEVEGDARGRLRPGAFHRAHKGTLLLEGVTKLPLAVQEAILHTVGTGEARAVGSDGTDHLDVRVIATMPLGAMDAMAAGALGPGLYHRLAGEEVNIPPLREHAEDIPDLITHWADRAASRSQWDFEPRAMDALTAYGWDGNTLKLRNVSARLARSGRETITLESLPPAIARAYRRTPSLVRVLAGLRSRLCRMAEAAATRPATTFDTSRRAPHVPRPRLVGSASAFQSLVRSLRAGLACVVCGVASLLR